MISNNLETHPLKLDGSAQAVIWNDANNRSRHTSSYYKQTDGALPGRLWKSGEILEHLEKGKAVSLFFPQSQTDEEVLVGVFWQAKVSFCEAAKMS